jgi:hypothetical protein
MPRIAALAHHRLCTSSHLPPPSSPGYFWMLMDLSWILDHKILFWCVCVPVTLVSCDMVYTTARKEGESSVFWWHCGVVKVF